MKKYFAVILMLSVCLLSGCGKKDTIVVPELLEPARVNVDTETAFISDLKDYMIYEGAILPKVHKLYFSTAGEIKTVNAYNGKWVEEGEVLITLRDDGLQEDIEALQEEIAFQTQEGVYDEALFEAELTLLQLDYQEMAGAEEPNEEALAAKQLEIDKKTLERTQAAQNRNASIAALNKSLNELNNQIKMQEIVAPAAGHVYYENFVQEGFKVAKDTILVYVQDPSESVFSVPAYISEKVLNRYKTTAKIDGVEYDLVRAPFNEEQMRKDYLAEKTITTDFIVQSEKSLEIGSSGYLFVETMNLEDVLLVPQNSILHEGIEDYVYVITENDRERRTVQIGSTDGVYVEIKSGLEEGEAVYVQN